MISMSPFLVNFTKKLPGLTVSGTASGSSCQCSRNRIHKPTKGSRAPTGDKNYKGI